MQAFEMLCWMEIVQIPWTSKIINKFIRQELNLKNTPITDHGELMESFVHIMRSDNAVKLDDRSTTPPPTPHGEQRKV